LAQITKECLVFDKYIYSNIIPSIDTKYRC